MAGDERDKCTGATDEFYSKSPGRRALVILNGPVVNFLLAYLSFVLVFNIGYPGLSTKITEVTQGKAAYQAGLSVGDELTAINGKKLYGWMHFERVMAGDDPSPVAVSFKHNGMVETKMIKPKIIEKTDILGEDIKYRDLGLGFLPNKIGSVVEGYPARKAGLQTGDVVTDIDGKKIVNWTQLQNAVSDSTGETIAVKVLRHGKERTFTIKPIIDTVKEEDGKTKEIRKIGIGPQQDFGKYTVGFGQSFGYAWGELSYITVLTYKALYRMATGSISARKSVTGPVGIFYIVKGAAEAGFSHLTFILGVISASLAIFNLLPILPLDGGHLFLLALEKARGRPLSEKVDDFVARLGLTFIILLALYVFYSDFSRFGIFEGIGHLLVKIKKLF